MRMVLAGQLAVRQDGVNCPTIHRFGVLPSKETDHAVNPQRVTDQTGRRPSMFPFRSGTTWTLTDTFFGKRQRSQESV